MQNVIKSLLMKRAHTLTKSEQWRQVHIYHKPFNYHAYFGKIFSKLWGLYKGITKARKFLERWAWYVQANLGDAPAELANEMASFEIQLSGDYTLRARTDTGCSGFMHVGVCYKHVDQTGVGHILWGKRKGFEWQVGGIVDNFTPLRIIDRLFPAY